jgi:site-specific DNA-methyltransferase (cytosine-N4-specific)
MNVMDWLDKCHFGDCRDTMRSMIADGVKIQTVITSPPYYGLRDYGHPGQLGLEETPNAYVAAMVDVFRCVRDVLADDGTLWLNVGDSYAGARSSGGTTASRRRDDAPIPRSDRRLPGIKPKDLIGIPWMLAFALRADGWYLRSDIIWSKGNPMPESVTDRPTKSHEYLFLLTKSERYYYDHEAIKEASVSDHPSGNGFKRDGRLSYQDENGARGNDEQWADVGGLRNRRSVWSINTKPYSGAHFAVFPEELVEPCVMAGSRVSDIVFDPFFGSGTTGQVAQRLGRRFIGCELNRGYEPLQRDRLKQPGLILETN